MGMDYNSCTDRIDKDDVGVVDFPQHLLNTRFRTLNSVPTRHQAVGHIDVTRKLNYRKDGRAMRPIYG